MEEAQSDSAHEFLTTLFDVDQLSALKKMTQRRHRFERFFSDAPESLEILTAFHLDSLKNSKKFIEGSLARLFHITESEEAQWLRKFLTFGLLEEKGGKYEPNWWFLNFRKNFSTSRSLRHYWLKRAMDYLKENQFQKKDDLFRYVVFSVDGESSREIQDILQNAFDQVTQVIQREGPKKRSRIQVLNLNLFTTVTDQKE